MRCISGLATAVFFILMLGEAGAYECGAQLKEVIVPLIICCGLMVVSFRIWENCGGNKR